MSDIKRVWANPESLWSEGRVKFVEGVELVYASDYDAAQVELAIVQKQLGERWLDISALNDTVERQSDEVSALREELANMKTQSGWAEVQMLKSVLIERESYIDVLHMRISAYEQRNAEILCLLRDLYEAVDFVWPEVDAALNPTESGASECICWLQPQEPQCVDCPGRKSEKSGASE